MTKIFKLLLLSIFVGLGQLMFVSCSDDDKKEEYIGTNSIELSSTSQSLVDGSGKELEVKVLLGKTLNKDLTLEFAFDNNTVDGHEIVSFKDSKITIDAGKKEATLLIKATEKASLSKTAMVKISLKSSSEKEMKMFKEFAINIIPKAIMDVLSAEKVELLDYYKEKGLDLYSIIGEIKVEGTVSEPGEGNYEPYIEKAEKTFTGTTIITLSEKATKEKPILKMTNNAMGIQAYLYDVLRNITILNTEYWAHIGEFGPPNFPKLVSLIDIRAGRVEDFDVILDDIELNFNNNNIKIIGEGKNAWGEKIKVVPFQFAYSAWDRLKKLVDEGNPIAMEVNEQGHSTNPDNYLNHSRIDKDDHKGGEINEYFLESKGNYDKDTKMLSFEFIMDNTEAGNYSVYKVKYTPNK